MILNQLLTKITEHLSHIRERAPEIVSEYQKRLHQRMQTLFTEVGANVSESDTLREVAIFAEKSDIAEEISRLDGHLEQFRELIGGPEEEPIGRTLDFLTQEMLRESNTIASKCLDEETSRRVVEIKGRSRPNQGTSTKRRVTIPCDVTLNNALPATIPFRLVWQ